MITSLLISKVVKLGETSGPISMQSSKTKKNTVFIAKELKPAEVSIILLNYI